MAPIGTVLAVALLALSGVDAKRRDKVQYSTYSSSDCNGHPLEGKLYDLKLNKHGRSECTSIDADSFKFHKHPKDKNNHWIDDVNSGKIQCYATLYRGIGCLGSKSLAHISLPEKFNNCTATGNQVAAVQWTCEPDPGWNGVAYQHEIELPVTSYSIGVDGKAYPSVYTTMVNATMHEYPNINVFTQTTVSTKVEMVTVTTSKLNVRAEPTHKAPLEPRRKKHNLRGVWMKHPWTRSDICYMCYTKKEYDFGKFDCRSGGKNNKYAIDCGPKPEEVPQTSTYLTTSTDLVAFFHTTTDQFSDQPRPTATVEKRSPHTPVVLTHPYVPGEKVCADAEWENSGKSKAEVRIQKVRALRKCNKKQPLNIDIGIPEHTLSKTSTVSATVTSV
ncbi:hypothetical protein N0V90_007877 [Kalmusia sp. IMI 367209]|nr:hypothetical protein N0V90_007877 [Kalmusia sp. IMI 367209]